MDANGVFHDRTVVDCCAAKAELERLLADARLHLTDRNRAFLRYAADQTFAGNARGAKAYSIAIDVFGRPSNFDPALDPIVRIEAARIRAALEQYYDAYGEPGGVRITLPRGHYIAEFTHIDDYPAPEPRANSDCLPQLEAAPAHDLPVVHEREPLRLSRWRTVSALAAFCACITGLIIAAGIVWWTDKPGVRYLLIDKPLVRFTFSTSGLPAGERSDSLRQGLLTAISAFGTLRISGSTTAIPPRPAGASRQRFDDMGFDLSDYQINITYSVKQTVPSASWTVTETRSGETIASGKDDAIVLSRSPDETDAELVALLAKRFGSALGIVGTRELARHDAERTIGNVCVLQGDYAITHASRDDLADARTCLEATVLANRRDADAVANLARVLVAEDELEGSSVSSAQALTLANTAVALAPRSDRALGARMIALFAVGRPEAALVVGKQALASNPLNTSIAGSLALRLYIAGFWREGVSFARHATASPDAVSAEAELTLVLDAYRNGDDADAMRQLDTMLGDDALCASIRIATLARMGKRSEAVSALVAAGKAEPRIRDRLSGIMRERRFDPSLSAMLSRDVALADGWRAGAE